MENAAKKLVEMPPIVHSSVRERWGVAADTGWSAIPNILLVNQWRLQLTSEQLNVALNIFMHWHAKMRMPFPRVSTIAKRMGVSERSVHRTLKTLLDRGFLIKEKRKRYTAQSYDVTPLVHVLQRLSDERLGMGYPIELYDEETPPKAVQLVEVH